LKNKLKEISDEQKKQLLKDGVLVYFSKSNNFVFARKIAEARLGDKILQLKRSIVGNHPVQYFPISVMVGLVRDHIGEEEIKEYFEGDYMKLDMTREDFIFRHLEGAPIDVRHCKSKGNMERDDVLVKSWLTYRGSGKNLSMFNVV